jgi:hypothetical protein
MAENGGCSRCPEFMGCFPECRFPSATWVSTNTSDIEPPRWVKEWNAEMDRRAALARPSHEGD